MRLKKVLAMVLAAGMVCASLTACGSKTAESSAADTNGATTAADSAKAGDKTQNSGEKKVLTVTTWDYDSSPQFQSVVDAYMKENPNVEIKVIDTSADEYNNSLGISLSAAQPDPDIIWVKDMAPCFRWLIKSSFFLLMIS